MSEINLDLNKVKKAYFIGIGGIGMSAVARMFLLEGKDVSGSDLSASEVTTELEKIGAKILIGKTADSLPSDTDLVIYTVAIPETHPELVSARVQKIQTISYPESLAIISKDKFTIAVAGTHGKTTTTAMIAQIFIEAGLDPTVIVGSLLLGQKNGGKGEKSNFIAGKSQYFIVEACEYKRSFLNLRPNIAVITNIDDDHLDYYKNLAGIQEGFREFVNLVKAGGLVVTDAESEKIKPVLDGLNSGELNSGNFKIENYKALSADFNLKIPGQHNVNNAKAALAVALSVGVPREKAIRALDNFSGTWRRFEERGETKSGALVYDDYGHHPTEITATLKGAREKFPNQRIVVVYQPHLYSRTKEHLEEFGPALSIADEIIILPIYAAREPNDGTVSSELLVEKIKNNFSAVSFQTDFESAAEYLKKTLKKDEVLVIMGAGDVNKLADLVVA